MAKYAISREGIDALHSLAQSLQNASNGILGSCDKLIGSINGLEDGLGVYYEHILLLVQKVALTIKRAKEGDDGIDTLSQKYIPRLVSVIEEVYGFNDSSDDDDEPPQKVKVLRR